ncbi:MAG TPA: hypothetical protein VF450_16965 [Noviherbaspirillum sp.]
MDEIMLSPAGNPAFIISPHFLQNRRLRLYHYRTGFYSGMPRRLKKTNNMILGGLHEKSSTLHPASLADPAWLRR